MKSSSSNDLLQSFYQHAARFLKDHMDDPRTLQPSKRQRMADAAERGAGEVKRIVKPVAIAAVGLGILSVKAVNAQREKYAKNRRRRQMSANHPEPHPLGIDSLETTADTSPRQRMRIDREANTDSDTGSRGDHPQRDADGKLQPRTDNPANMPGAHAKVPTDIPAKGIKEVAIRVGKEVGNDQLTFVSAGIAFYALLGMVPLLAALVSIYGLWADPATVANQVAQLQGVVPAEAMTVIEEQMNRMASDDSAAGWGMVLGILGALWGGAKAFDALIIGLNIAYDEKESRNFIRKKLTSIGLTLGSILVIALGISAAIMMTTVVDYLGVSDGMEALIHLAGWPLLLFVLMAWLAVIYRLGPFRSSPRWRWVSWGALIAAVTWMAVSVVFSLYVSNFGSYNESYGTLGGIIVLMLWFFMSGFAVLLGAEINAELEHQTTKDTTVGRRKPIGSRGAFVADDVLSSKERTEPSVEAKA